MAPQLIATKGPSRRELRVWMARAISSLPVPLSPSMRTVASVFATRCTTAKISRMRGVLPMISSKRTALSRACAAASPSRASSAK